MSAVADLTLSGEAALVEGKGQCCKNGEEGRNPPSLAELFADSPDLHKELSRNRLRRRRAVAANILRGQRPRDAETRDGKHGRWYPVSACSTVPHQVGMTFDVRASGRVDGYGQMRCGSVWTCPECAQRIATHRAIEIKTVIERARAEGDRVEMVTYTLPHDISMPASEGMRRIKDALSFLSSHGSARNVLNKLGFIGQVRSIEVTYGHVSGWHFHAHAVLVFRRYQILSYIHSTSLMEEENYSAERLDPTEDGAAFAVGESAAEDFESSRALRKKLYPIWKNAAHSVGAGTPHPKYGLDVRAVWSANDYLSKLPEPAKAKEAEGKGRWGAEAELSKAYMKEGRKSSRTPWEILDTATTVDADANLFREYARATWGRSQIEWSKGGRDLRRIFLDGAENKADEAIVYEDPEWAFDDEAGEVDVGQENVVVERVTIASEDAWRGRREAFGSIDRAILLVERGDALSLASALEDEGWTMVKIKDAGPGVVRRPDRAGHVRECFTLEPAEWAATWPVR